MTYFLLCGYMPFDADAAKKTHELDNILQARFEFHSDYWMYNLINVCNVSDDAKSFISSLLIVDATKRLTAAEALKHSWIDSKAESPTHVDLLPHVRMGFNARKTFRRAIDVVKAVNNFSRPSSYNNLISNPSSKRGSIDGEGDEIKRESLYVAFQHL